MSRVAPPEPKFRRRAENRPDELLDAALELFQAQGYAATSVARIAREAGVSKGAVYLYFPSKQAILEGLVKRAVTPISTRALAQVTASQGDVRASLTGFMTMVAGQLGDPKVFAVPRIIMREAVNAPEIAQLYRDAVLDAAMPTMIGVIRDGIAAGQIRPVDPEMTLRSIMGPIVIHLLLSEVFAITPPEGLSIERLIENHLDILFNGLLAQPESAQDA